MAAARPGENSAGGHDHPAAGHGTVILLLLLLFLKHEHMPPMCVNDMHVFLSSKLFTHLSLGKYANCVTFGLITCCEPHTHTKKKIHQGFYFVLLSLCFSIKLHRPRKILYFLYTKKSLLSKAIQWSSYARVGLKK